MRSMQVNSVMPCCSIPNAVFPCEQSLAYCRILGRLAQLASRSCNAALLTNPRTLPACRLPDIVGTGPYVIDDSMEVGKPRAAVQRGACPDRRCGGGRIGLSRTRCLIRRQRGRADGARPAAQARGLWRLRRLVKGARKDLLVLVQRVPAALGGHRCAPGAAVRHSPAARPRPPRCRV